MARTIFQRRPANMSWPRGESGRSTGSVPRVRAPATKRTYVVPVPEPSTGMQAFSSDPQTAGLWVKAGLACGAPSPSGKAINGISRHSPAVVVGEMTASGFLQKARTKASVATSVPDR